MDILAEAELSQNIFSLLKMEESSEGKEKIQIPDVIIKSARAKKILEDWFSKQSDLDNAKSFLKKLSQLSLNPQTILAVFLFLLCQKEEDSQKKIDIITNDEPENLFSDAVILYKRMLKVNQFPKRPKNQKQIELTLRMFLTVLADVQLLTVFLVLQLHKLEQIDTLSKENKDVTAWVALNIHAPLAGRLGIFWIKSELEDRAFRHIEYDKYQILKNKIARKRSDRSESVEIILSKIQFILNKAGIIHEVQGRYKRFYSIFQKLEKVDNDFKRIKDLIAFRVVVNKVDDCYAALSFIHETWSPVKNRFKDYIVKPKSNGYQSLHTTVEDVNGYLPAYSGPIEIQIRTREMHRIAEYGVAAHWLYKEKKQQSKEENSETIGKFLAEKSKTTIDENSIPIIDLFFENIYVMTPEREIIELPKIATPIDFAYLIHTDIGNKTTGAKANGKIIKLDSKLQSGDILEILTSPRQEPKKEWLEFAKTRHSRNKIKHALHQKSREAFRKQGFEMLEREFKDQGLHLNRLIRDGRMEQESRKNKNQEFEHILLCIGEGSIKSEEVRKWFLDNPGTSPEDSSTKETKMVEKKLISKKNKIIRAYSDDEILVDGMKNVMIRIARCCSPIKNQPIRGFLTKEKIISIHNEKCPFLLKLSPKRIVNVNWSRSA